MEAIEVAKKDLIKGQLMALTPYLAEDTNARLEGELEGLKIAGTLSLDEIKEERQAVKREIRILCMEDDLDAERVEFLQGLESQLKFLEDRLTELTVLFLHRGK